MDQTESIGGLAENYEYRVLTPQEEETHRAICVSFGREPLPEYRRCARRPRNTTVWFIHHLAQEEMPLFIQPKDR
jgi:hypothetical protein